MSFKEFKLVCPHCQEVADVMSYRRVAKNKLKVTYICPDCGKGDEEEHFMYED